jgi:tryptophanyl-tRNA synthetase
MSKSYGNAIALREDRQSVTKKIRTMPTDPARVRRTDPGDPRSARCGSCTRCIPTPTQGLGGQGLHQRRHRLPRMQAAGDRRRHLAEQEPMHERAQQYLDDPSLVRAIVADGCDKGAQAGPGNHARRARGHGPGLHVICA